MKTDPGFDSMLVTSIVAGVLMAMVGGGGAGDADRDVPDPGCARPRSALATTFPAAIFGGFAPFICTWLVRQTRRRIAPTYFLLFCAP